MTEPAFRQINGQRFEYRGKDEPYYFGRWFEKDIDGIPHHVTVNDGAQIYFLVEGAAAFQVLFTVITTGPEPYFAYSIDGSEPIRQHITDSTVLLPDAGRHTVCLITDGLWEGEGKWYEEKGFAVRSIQTVGGELTGIRPLLPTVIFYGDSITEGIRALNMAADSEGNSATHSYTWYCAQELGVLPYFVGYGASGMIRPGSFNIMQKAIDHMTFRHPEREDLTPSLLLVQHGQNDSSMPSGEFLVAARDALSRLREKYPTVPIVYMIPFTQAQADAIRAAVADVENSLVIETSDWPVSYTDHICHPDIAGAMEAGHRLAVALRERFPSCLTESVSE